LKEIRESLGQSDFESDRGEEKESLRIEREKGLKVLLNKKRRRRLE